MSLLNSYPLCIIKDNKRNKGDCTIKSKNLPDLNILISLCYHFNYMIAREGEI